MKFYIVRWFPSGPQTVFHIPEAHIAVNRFFVAPDSATDLWLDSLPERTTVPEELVQKLVRHMEHHASVVNAVFCQDGSAPVSDPDAAIHACDVTQDKLYRELIAMLPSVDI